MATYAYQRIVSDIERDISSGTLEVGARLPTTEELCEHYGVSKSTIKRAMDELAQRGIVMRRRGSGTYVRGVPPTRHRDGMLWNVASQIGGFAAECAERGLQPGAKVHEFTICTAPYGAATQLCLTDDEPCYHIVRTLCADKTPLMVEDSYLPVRVIPNLREEHARGSLFHYVENVLGLTISSSNRLLAATHPDAVDAARLNIDQTDPVLAVYQTSYLSDGRPFEHSMALHVPGYQYYTLGTH